MTDDALERLRNKVKPKVDNRDLSTVSAAPAATSNNEIELREDKSVDIAISTLPDIAISTSLLSGEDRSNTGSTALATKQTTIRLEKQILQRISKICQESEISREVLLEACFIYFEENKSARSKIIKEARRRDERRKDIANQRRAKSMIEKYG